MPRDSVLSSYYCGMVKKLSLKSMLKLDPSVKRSLCKKCSSPLVPGLTSTVRLNSRSKSKKKRRKKNNRHGGTISAERGTIGSSVGAPAVESVAGTVDCRDASLPASHDALPERIETGAISVLAQKVSKQKRENVPSEQSMNSLGRETISATVKAKDRSVETRSKKKKVQSSSLNVTSASSAAPNIGRKRRKHRIKVVKCLKCNSLKRYVVNNDHQLWQDSGEAHARVVTLE